MTLENGRVANARVALAAVAPIPLYVREAAGPLIGRAPSDDSFREAAAIAAAHAKPITDMRGTAGYRRHLCAVLTRRALEQALVQARKES